MQFRHGNVLKGIEMKQGQRRPFWPYLCVVACLFILTIMAPKTWLRESPRPKTPVTLLPSLDIEFQATDGSSDPLSIPPVAPQLRRSDIEEPLFLDEYHRPVGALVSDIIMVELASDAQPVIEIVPQTPAIPRADNDSETAPQSVQLQPGIGAQIEPLGTHDMRRLPEVLQLTANPAIPNGANYPNTGFPVPPALPKPDSVPLTPAAGQQPEPVESVTNPCVRPVGLISQLQELSQHDEARIIAQSIKEEVQRLAKRPTLSDDAIPHQLYKIESLASELEEMSKHAESIRLKSDLKRTIYAVRRRLTIWDQAHQLVRSQNYASIDSPNIHRLKEAMELAKTKIEDSRYQDRWHGYLGLAPVELLIHGDLSAESIGKLRSFCAISLLRIESPMLNDSQQRLMTSPEFISLTDALRPWATQPVDVEELLYYIESYEMRGGSSSGEHVSQNYHWLRWSGRAPDEQFANELNTHYRNANIRIAISKDLVNRLIPGSEVYTEPVQDTIMGALVRGHSTTSNKVGIKLIPANEKWRVIVAATGQVASNTRSSRGPATFYNRGSADFHAEKEISVTPNGLQLHQSRVGAYTGSDLHNVETDFDSVPLIGIFARAIAIQQHDSHIDQADGEMRRKVARRVQAKFDSEVQSRVNQATEQFRTKIYNPLRDLNVDPIAIEMKTTDDRMIARYRLAAPNQLAANTPRPLAPSDSLLSAQIHQSSMNNMLQNLELDGQRLGIVELFEKIGNMFPRTPMSTREEMPENVTVEFAKYDAVRVQCDDGMITLTLKIQELQSGQKVWEKFIVRAHYRPDSNTLDAKLTREGYIELQGKRLRLVDQAALRGIFGRVFDKQRKIPLISDQIAKNPKMQDSELTQCVMQDGWIGIAVGPKRPAIIGSRNVILK
ncbi:MAG: hypothetical protein ACI9G1_000048 [Pirellulaceae bacterium]|jgi:hypothetical protein